MKTLTPQQLDLFKNFLNGHDYFFIIGHKEPDGDCISSCLVLAEIIKDCNKQYELLSTGPFKRPEIKKFASQFSNQMQFLSQPERDRAGLIIADCSEFLRLGEIDGDLRGLDTFIIDHHKTASAPENSITIIDPTSPSTATLVQMIYEGICGKPSKKIADLLFFGLSTDSGFFRFLNTDSAEVFKAAARLVTAGTNPRTIYDEITSGKPFSTRKLIGIMLDKAQSYYGGKLIITFETMEDTKKYGQAGRDSDGLYQLLLSSENVEAAVFLRQESENSCTGGFRSKNDIDVSLIASKFGGGGHKNAAGMSVEGKLETLIPQIQKEFSKILKK